MANKVKFGLSNVHIAKITYGTDSSGNTTITYGTPFALPGAVNLSLDPEGESADFYADNVKYFSEYSNQGYSGSLEIAMINDKFRTEILGETIDENGALFENINDKISDFAIGFEVNGDQANRRFWYYSATVSRPTTGSQTIEASKTPATDTLNITTAGRVTDGQVKNIMEKSADNVSAYNSYFESVYEKVTSPSA